MRLLRRLFNMGSAADRGICVGTQITICCPVVEHDSKRWILTKGKVLEIRQGVVKAETPFGLFEVNIDSVCRDDD